MNSINVEGFTFNHVGDFHINSTKSAKKYTWGKTGEKRCEQLVTCIRLFEDSLKKMKELAYLVTVDGEPMYVGEFSNSFENRWLKVDNYVWHHKDDLIYDDLKKKKKVALWFVEDPFVDISSGVKLNISKSIEHHILKNKTLKWNIRNN